MSRFKDSTGNEKYVTNAELLPVLLRDQATGVMSDELGLMMYKIADRYSRSPNFKHYSFRDEMVALAVVHLMKAWKKFDPERGGNPFSFFTTACYYAFVHVLNLEREQRDIKVDLWAQNEMVYGFTKDREQE